MIDTMQNIAIDYFIVFLLCAIPVSLGLVLGSLHRMVVKKKI